MARDDLKVLQRYVVYPSEETYPVRHGAQAIDLAKLTPADAECLKLSLKAASIRERATYPFMRHL